MFKKALLFNLIVAILGAQSAFADEDKAVTVDDAKKFVENVEKTLLEEREYSARVEWVQQNFITDDTVWLGAKSLEKMGALQSKFASEAQRFDKLELPADLRRKLNLIKGNLVLAYPRDKEKNAELAEIVASLDAMYGKGKYCDKSGKCQDLGDLSKTIFESSDNKALLEAWTGWRTVSKPMREKYKKMVKLANEGAKDLGYADTGAMWRSTYDMPADDFIKEVDRQWGKVKPLYDALQCHVKAKLTEKYGKEVVGDDGMIPAHLLGNMWAMEWTGVYDLVKPENLGETVDVTKVLKDNKFDEKKMVKTAENFYTSLGFKPLPETFWKRSLFTKPKDREVVCHASAWDLDDVDDLRIKMCIKIDQEDFVTIHHELGHIFYYDSYKDKSIIYRTGANDGFHEAIGDTIALSVTPEYLKEIKLIDEVPDAENDLGILMYKALDRLAFVPFGLMVDKWRWEVFNGTISEDEYNAGWWRLRKEYQGIKPPLARTEEDFDPGSKYHIPGNVPYMRYFLAHILQFQFHRDLCKAAGFEGPLHRCTIYNNKAAGEKLIKMLEAGASRPWQDTLEELSGSREMDASAIIDYFAPLKAWLDEQNKDRNCGW